MDVFLRYIRLESLRWEVVDLGVYEDALLERRYWFLLSGTLDEWLKYSEQSR